MEEGGLGLKHVALFNIALLSKWRWRILNDEGDFWAGLLSYRYGNIKIKYALYLQSVRETLCGGEIGFHWE